MSFCSAILFLLFIPYVAGVSGSLLHLCFIDGGLIPMLQVWFFLSSGLLLSYCYSTQHNICRWSQLEEQPWLPGPRVWLVYYSSLRKYAIRLLSKTATCTEENEHFFSWQSGAGCGSQARCWMCYLKPSGISCFHHPGRLMLASGAHPDTSSWCRKIGVIFVFIVPSFQFLNELKRSKTSCLVL